MFGIGETELIIIVVFAIMVFGPDKLPGMGRTIGRVLRQFREAQEGFSQVVQAEVVDPLNEAMNEPSARKKVQAAAAAAEADADLDSDLPEGVSQKKAETFAERKARLKAEREAREAAELETEAATLSAAESSSTDELSVQDVETGESAESTALADGDAPIDKKSASETRSQTAQRVDNDTTAQALYALTPHKRAVQAKETASSDASLLEKDDPDDVASDSVSVADASSTAATSTVIGEGDGSAEV